MFLAAMAKTDEDNRRRYERIDGNGSRATLRVRGGEDAQVAIVNISRGGVALRTDWFAPAGTEVQLGLPGASGAVVARTVRSQGGMLALAFRQDESVLRQVDIALEHIDSRNARGAAAA
jgi:hypothetical protein